jgi:deoxyxylulose-5-phosphate synthase
MYEMLKKLNGLPGSLQDLEMCELEELSVQMRAALLMKLAEVGGGGGHVGPNLGVVLN